MKTYPVSRRRSVRLLLRDAYICTFNQWKNVITTFTLFDLILKTSPLCMVLTRSVPKEWMNGVSQLLPVPLGYYDNRFVAFITYFNKTWHWNYSWWSVSFSISFQDIKLTSSNDDDYFVFEDVLCQVRPVEEREKKRKSERKSLVLDEGSLSKSFNLRRSR